MDSYTTLAKAIKYACISLAIIVFLCIWPFGLIRNNVSVRSDEVMACESEAVNVENHIDQMFTATEGELKSVDLYVVNDMSGQTVTFRLYDENHAQIFERFYDVPEDFTGDGFIHIPVRYGLEGGKDYYFIIEGLTADMYVAFEERATADTVNYFMTHGDKELPEYDVIIRYNYGCDAAWWMLLALAFILVALCVAVSVAVKKLPERSVKVRSVFRWIFNPILALVAIGLLYVVLIRGIFDISKKNNLMIILGYWMILAIGAYIVNYGQLSIGSLPRSTKTNKIKAFFEKVCALKPAKYLRIISLATVLWYCYDYMNGLYDIFHYYSISKLAIAFLFFLIFTFDKKELFNIPNAIWLVVGPVLGYIYYRPMVGDVELEELYRLNGWVIAVGGFVVINLVYCVIRLIKKQISLPKTDIFFMIPFGVFAIGICALCNTREWPWMLIVMCLLLMFRLLIWHDRREFSKELCAAIVLNFYMMVWFSLRHRPYYYYRYSRYYMGFHTVTVTAYYLAMIVSAAFVRFLDCLKSRNKVYIITRLFTLGMALSFLIFTMSRTGFLSAGTALLFGLIVWAVCNLKKGGRIKKGVKMAALMLAACVYMFPVTYALVDTVPRLANDPVTFEYEYRYFTFYEGMPLKSEYYMNIDQFITVFKEKVLGIGADTEAKLKSILHPFTLYAYAANDEYTENAMATEDMSNGRFTIFKCYLGDMNLWGHDEMGTELPDGEIAVHAHNTFIQVMYDHGIIFGIYFVLFIGYILVYSIIRAYRSRADVYKMFCPVILVCFGMASLVEWILHPCNPLGLTCILAMVPLCIKDGDNEKVH